jgi:hypothetical protein
LSHPNQFGPASRLPKHCTTKQGNHGTNVMTASLRRGGYLFCVAVLNILLPAQSSRYLELRHVISRNTAHAHMTRGVNMYTLYALRSCVSESDIAVLSEMLRDKDRITRMATAWVLVDLGAEGSRVVRARSAEVEDVTERLMLQDSLDAAAKPDYRPILQYPLTSAEQRHIHGCGRAAPNH